MNDDQLIAQLVRDLYVARARLASEEVRHRAHDDRESEVRNALALFSAWLARMIQSGRPCDAAEVLAAPTYVRLAELIHADLRS